MKERMVGTMILLVLSGALAKEVQLEEVSVTATRTERKTEEVPASVSVVGKEKLKEKPMFNLYDALQGISGINITSRNQGYDTRLIIRGAGLKAPYGVREIMVLLNGVPITDPDSLTRLDFVDTSLIERVEVVKGPNSTLWGVNASGGVINVIT
ncbi:MAG: TonB-dependent receptor, partial [Hydrogenobacter sp.]